MKSLAQLLVSLLEDTRSESGDRGADSARDISTVLRRGRDEGDSFFTITLPTFAQSLERALERGWVAPTDFDHFSKVRVGGTPKFLQGYLRNVFAEDGKILSEPSVAAIRAVRQVCLFAKKVQRETTDGRKLAAVKKFIECEDEVNNENNYPHYDAYRDVCGIIVSHSIPADFWHKVMPKHGPGVTADRISGNQKFRLVSWHARLQGVFPFDEFARGQSISFIQDIDSVDFVEPGRELPVKVTLVPKTLKTPRVIAVEPTCMQYMQQGLSSVIVPSIERGRFTKGHVNFTDQTVNQSLAKEASVNRKLATLDLSEASDRVSLEHVRTLLRVHPFLLECVLACRSTRAKLPTGEVLTLKKFASMGSALCFPIEALVFFCAIVSIRLKARNLAVTTRRIIKYSRDVYVYGDDLIVPADEASWITQGLEAMGLKVNTAKSFSQGNFRESCGGDFYKGEPVKPVYLRRDLPECRRDSNSIVSAVSTCNQLFEAGYYRTAQHLKESVEELIGSLPTVTEPTGVLGWRFYNESSLKTRYNRDLQRVERLAWVTKTSRRHDVIDDDAALLKCFGTIGVETEPRHLVESVRPRVLTITRKWAYFT